MHYNNELDQDMRPHQPVFNIPFIIAALLGGMAGIHLVSVYLLSEQNYFQLVFTLGFVPAHLLAMINLGGTNLLTSLSMISYSLLHADWTHLIVNSVWMLAFGSVVARRTGTAVFLLFCGFASICGALFHLGANPGSSVPMIGASAVVAGCMGAAMRFAFPANGGFSMQAHNLPLQSIMQSFRNRQVVAFIVIWFALNFAFGFGGDFITGHEGSIAWQAHIGGFLAGLLGFGLFERLITRY